MTAGEITAEQPAGIGRENPYFDNPAARRLVDELLKAGDGRTGDHLSAAIRAITSSASSLPVDQVDAAIAAIALLLAERAPARCAPCTPCGTNSPTPTDAEVNRSCLG